MLLTSCHYKLKRKDIQYIIPYQGNEILIFRSDQNRMDTIFFKGTEKGSGSAFPGELSLNSHELFSLQYAKESADFFILESSTSIPFVFISARQNNPEIWFATSILKDSRFYFRNFISLADFKKMPNTELTIGNKTYNDVKILEPDDKSTKRYAFRDNFVERFYWSVSEGFLGLDKRDEQWRLVEKYVP
jgi:hypothetical protein